MQKKSIRWKFGVCITVILLYRGIPLKDPTEKPDPYVKLYLLPGRSKETKRKTIIAKESCDPVYEATFEYIISSAELKNTELEVTVATQKGIFSGGSPIIGMVFISSKYGCEFIS